MAVFASTRRRRPAEVPPAVEEDERIHTRGSSKKKSASGDESLLYVLFLKTGIVVAALMWILWTLLSQSDEASIINDDDDVSEAVNVNEVRQEPPDVVDRTSTPPPLTKFAQIHWEPLTDRSSWDAFDTAKRLQPKDDKVHLFWQTAQGLRQRFVELYGARVLLEQTLTTAWRHNDTPTGIDQDPPSNLVQTACRFERARREKRPFRLHWASSDGARGHRFHDHYAMKTTQILQSVLRLLNIDVHVTHDGVVDQSSSLPYAVCTVGVDDSRMHAPDMITWDYPKERSTASLEVFLRRSQMFSTRPKLVVFGEKDDERRLVRAYQPTLLSDPVLVHASPAAQKVLQQPPHLLPEGFQKWNNEPYEFPQTATSGSRPRAEHDLYAWLLSMHLLAALEVVAASEGGRFSLSCPTVGPVTAFPPPLFLNASAHEMALLAGRDGKAAESDNLHKRYQRSLCRTSFDPLTKSNETLSSLVVSGSMGEQVDILLPRSMMYYSRAWVIDLSAKDRKERLGLDIVRSNDGLGFVDLKKAYFGVYMSGTLRLFLPCGDSRPGESANFYATKAAISPCIASILVCQVPLTSREFGACNAAHDVQYTVGGVNVTANARSVGDDLLCTALPVPATAQWTTRRALRASSLRARQVVLPANTIIDDGIGLCLTISVTNPHIIRREQACSVSHVIWEANAAGPSSTSVADR